MSELNEVEKAAAEAIENDPEVDVGYEGIGGLYMGQAELIIDSLKRHGFAVIRADTLPSIHISDINHERRRRQESDSDWLTARVTKDNE